VISTRDLQQTLARDVSQTLTSGVMIEESDNCRASDSIKLSGNDRDFTMFSVSTLINPSLKLISIDFEASSSLMASTQYDFSDGFSDSNAFTFSDITLTSQPIQASGMVLASRSIDDTYDHERTSVIMSKFRRLSAYICSTESFEPEDSYDDSGSEDASEATTVLASLTQSASDKRTTIFVTDPVVQTDTDPPDSADPANVSALSTESFFSFVRDESNQRSTSHAGLIGGLVSGFMLLGVIATIAILMLRRRKHSSAGPELQFETHSPAVTATGGNGSLTYDKDDYSLSEQSFATAENFCGSLDFDEEECLV
jgi:hypothetical protein